MSLIPLKSEGLYIPLGYLLRDRYVLKVKIITANSQEELNILREGAVHEFGPVLELPSLPVDKDGDHAAPLSLSE